VSRASLAINYKKAITAILGIAAILGLVLQKQRFWGRGGSGLCKIRERSEPGGRRLIIKIAITAILGIAAILGLVLQKQRFWGRGARGFVRSVSEASHAKKDL